MFSLPISEVGNEQSYISIKRKFSNYINKDVNRYTKILCLGSINQIKHKKKFYVYHFIKSDDRKCSMAGILFFEYVFVCQRKIWDRNIF